MKNFKEKAVTTGAHLILSERQRQLDEEHWSNHHDDEHRHGEMISAARAYALQADRQVCGRRVIEEPLLLWPFEASWWKPSEDPIRNLVKAGALIAAEIDRLQRCKPSE